MKEIEISCRAYSVHFEITEHNVYVKGGNFHNVHLARYPLFSMLLRDRSGRDRYLDSVGWGHVETTPVKGGVVWTFSQHERAENLSVIVSAMHDGDGISFEVGVDNTSTEYSVMEIGYPTPHLRGRDMKVFLPDKAGKVLNTEQGKRRMRYDYPQHACMQFFAVYNAQGGIYLGIEDGTASAKYFEIEIEPFACYIRARYHAPDAITAGNSFIVAGRCRWQAMQGDWYDAAQIYRAFVEREATWLPEAGIGRPDTPARFHKIPFWVSDYIPNSPTQGDNRPMNLSAGSDIYEPDYWYRAPIALRERLGVPLAYHVYNWHEIPFNIEYPHFLPAREEFVAHAEELRQADIAVLPYINACAWETRDSEGDHEETFDTHGYRGAAVRENGDYVVEHYPQTTCRGFQSDLAIMCGGYEPWHARIAALAQEMQRTLPIDGIYFDELANMPAYPCYSRDHGHASGGGSYWTEGYNSMMRRIREGKPAEHFHFTECNAEPYMKHMDGFLTWMWVDADEVPAFTAVYNGYIQLIGRCTIGNKKEDFDFFKYATAMSLVSGQVLGWCKADVVWSERHMRFLERMVRCRYENADFIGSALMLRPPHITTDREAYTTQAGLWFTDTIRSEWVVGGAYRREGEVRIFLVNFSNTALTARVTVPVMEYEVHPDDLHPAGSYHPEGDTYAFSVTVPAESVRVLVVPTAE